MSLLVTNEFALEQFGTSQAVRDHLNLILTNITQELFEEKLKENLKNRTERKILKLIQNEQVANFCYKNKIFNTIKEPIEYNLKRNSTTDFLTYLKESKPKVINFIGQPIQEKFTGCLNSHKFLKVKIFPVSIYFALSLIAIPLVVPLVKVAWKRVPKICASIKRKFIKVASFLNSFMRENLFQLVENSFNNCKKLQYEDSEYNSKSKKPNSNPGGDDPWFWIKILISLFLLGALITLFRKQIKMLFCRLLNLRPSEDLINVEQKIENLKKLSKKLVHIANELDNCYELAGQIKKTKTNAQKIKDLFSAFDMIYLHLFQFETELKKNLN
jgi:hypothetical protein